MRHILSATSGPKHASLNRDGATYFRLSRVLRAFREIFPEKRCIVKFRPINIFIISIDLFILLNNASCNFINKPETFSD